MKRDHFFTDTYYGNRVERVLRCPREKCQRLFISRYHLARPSDEHRLVGSVPVELMDENFSDEVKEISKDFCEIYNESQKAEKRGLTLVAGPGYRKSLEFLVKDYLCARNPGEAEEIKRTQLGPCIQKYAMDGRVKAMAARAAWLGNDETHYVRKWEGKDLTDVKKLIGLTLNWIQAEELTKDVMVDMPEGKK